MFYMKSDNIEELFREAAEKYQIDTEAAAAWSDVHDAVHSDDEPAQLTPPEDKRKKRWLNLGWLLLIPLGWFAHNIWNDIQEPKTAQKQQVAVNIGTDKNNAKVESGNVNTDNKSNSAAASNKGVNNNAIVKDNTNVKENATVKIATIEKPPYKNTASLSAKISNANIGQIKQASQGKEIFSNKNDPGGINSVNKIDKRENVTPGSSTALTTQDLSRKELPQSSAAPGNSTGTQKAGGIETGVVNASDVKATKEETPQKNEVAINKDAAKKDKGATPKSEHYFYGGFLVAPDVSFIHFQKASNAGIGGGLLLGYHFNNRLSVETGLLFDRKNYYTRGKYFDGSKVALIRNNPDISINSVDGDCNMFEIPVNLKYSFISKSKNSLYGVAGVSSYLMGHEYYNFNYTWWGANYNGGYPYDNHVKNWFSIINLGVGYERKLNLKTSLRIEPYMKIPVSGVGTGNIAITSTGLYIGLTRRIP